MGGGGGGDTRQTVEIPDELKELYQKTGERMLALQTALPMIGQSQWYQDNQNLYAANPNGLFRPRPGIDPLTGKPAALPPHAQRPLSETRRVRGRTEPGSSSSSS